MDEIVKWDPFQDMTRFFEEVDKLFAGFLKSFSDELYATQMIGSHMNLQVRDEGKDIVITGDIPNAVKDTVDVVLRQDQVIVSGETTAKENGGQEYHWSKFTRARSLPAKVKSEGATVDLKNGKLTVRVPKE